MARLMSKSTRRTVFGFLARWLAPWVLTGLRSSNNLETDGDRHVRGLERTDQNYILAFWHGHMLPLLFRFWREGFYCFISPHRDGEYIARAVDGLDQHSLRTSLRDRRLKSLVRALRLARRGERFAVTVDGPLGPAFEVKPGIVQLSAKTGLPVVPAAGLASRAHVASSWDRFCLPLPLGTIRVTLGEPLRFSEEDDLEPQRRTLERTLRDLTRRTSDNLPGTRLYRRVFEETLRDRTSPDDPSDPPRHP